MKRYFIFSLIGLSFVTQSFASSSQNKKDFCALTREDFIAQFQTSGERLAFPNPAGYLDIGLCWWDAMFQRSSVYLTVFRPDLPSPTDVTAKQIISDIIHARKVIEIPGFKNMFDFSTQYQAFITHALSDWQLEDGFIKQKWIIDLIGTDKTSGQNLGAHMDQIYQSFMTTKTVPFVRIKLGRVVSHALLFLGMTPLPNNGGYQLEILDVNYPDQTMSATYDRGTDWLSLPNEDISQAVPYLAFESQTTHFEEAIQAYCAAPAVSGVEALGAR
jgi:hypothetical protein